MSTVITIGGATQDIYFNTQTNDFISITKKGFSSRYLLCAAGEKIETSELYYTTGGGATNSAASFSRLGFETYCFCTIGNDPAGQAIISDLTKEKVKTDLVTISQEHQSGVSAIINAHQGERTLFTYRGANSHLHQTKIPFEHIKKSSLIYVSSLSNEASSLLPEITSFAKNNKCTVAVNPGASQLSQGAVTLKESLKNIDILILNCSEAKILMMSLIEHNKDYFKALKSSPETKTCSIDVSTEQPYLIDNLIPYENIYFSIQKFFKKILTMGPTMVALTNGCNGVYLATKDSIYFHPSLKTSIIDTVGAGDSFGSCFVGSLQNKESLENSLRYGIINSGSVLSLLGTKKGLLSFPLLKKKRQELDPHLLQTFSLQQ